jgi:3-oxoacyl-[acyl-carrier protein] reductase
MIARRVLVTGSSRGIGQAIARRLARDGFAVTVHCRNGTVEARKTCDEIAALGVPVTLLQFDVRDRIACRDKLLADIAAHGAYYGVVSNAGIARDNAFPALSDDDWDEVIETSLDGFFNVVHPLIMPMVRARQGGRIVTVASVSGVTGNRGQVNYSAAKAGVIGATKALAVELASRSITVNCVAPGFIDTDMTSGLSADIGNAALNLVPMKRVGTSGEVAAAVAFLMSDEAGYITRQVIGINGGIV